jgi:hypothetical protein
MSYPATPPPTAPLPPDASISRCESRNASRTSRLARFRAAAFPTRLPTLRPSRQYPRLLGIPHTISGPATFFAFASNTP